MNSPKSSLNPMPDPLTRIISPIPCAILAEVELRKRIFIKGCQQAGGRSLNADEIKGLVETHYQTAYVAALDEVCRENPELFQQMQSAREFLRASMP